MALTLRAVGGLTTQEIADAFYVPEAPMAARISRAKRALHGRRLDQPGDLAVVLRVLYLVYTAGHAGRLDLAGRRPPVPSIGGSDEFCSDRRPTLPKDDDLQITF